MALVVIVERLCGIMVEMIRDLWRKFGDVLSPRYFHITRPPFSDTKSATSQLPLNKVARASNCTNYR